ncbi:ATP12 family chaperone protein [Thalassospira alkalitolerans]|uniref:ATP12 family chaperone protein n=1 Tax=Thalassospira alkalitolerans TaxID=1293890 RepID=UPI0030EC5CF6|tara:strand:- start:62504 stop:63220 length:717 start_codon:yes stop_codon:yes gene_type:complete
MMLRKSIKRFYKKAEAVRDDAAQGWRIHLDDRAVKTPGKAEFVLPVERLAHEIATEWDAQGEKVVPATMPIMQLAATAIDRVRPHRDAVIAELTGFGRSDLLCYRASFPDDLVLRQAEAWQPLLDWAQDDLRVALSVTEGVMPISQNDEALINIQDTIKTLDDYYLTALHTLTTVSGSVIIGLATLRGRISAEQAFEYSQLDEIYAIEQWGADAEAVVRRDRHRAELLAAGRYLDLLP